MEELKFKNRTLGSVIILTLFLAGIIWLFVSVGSGDDVGDILTSVLVAGAFFALMYVFIFLNSTVFKVNEKGIHFDFLGKKSLPWEKIQAVRFIQRDSRDMFHRGNLDFRHMFKKEIRLLIEMEDRPIRQSAANLAQIQSAGYSYDDAMKKMSELRQNTQFTISLDNLVMKPEEVHALLLPYIRRYCPDQEFIGRGVGTDGVLFTELEF